MDRNRFLNMANREGLGDEARAAIHPFPKPEPPIRHTQLEVAAEEYDCSYGQHVIGGVTTWAIRGMPNNIRELLERLNDE